MDYRRALSIVVALGASLTAAANPSRAQTSDPQAVLPATPIPFTEPLVVPSLSPATDSSEQALREAELEQRVQVYTEWKEWEDRWQGKPEPGCRASRAQKQARSTGLVA